MIITGATLVTLGAALGVESSRGGVESSRGEGKRSKAAVTPQDGGYLDDVEVRAHTPFTATPSLFSAIVGVETAKKVVYLFQRMADGTPGTFDLKISNEGWEAGQAGWSFWLNRTSRGTFYLDVNASYLIRLHRHRTSEQSEDDRQSEDDIAVAIVRSASNIFDLAYREQAHLIATGPDDRYTYLMINKESFQIFKDVPPRSPVEILRAIRERLDTLDRMAVYIKTRFESAGLPYDVQAP